MKTIVNKFFILFIYLLNIAGVFAAPNPPPPNGKNQGTPPPPPGLPIDEYNTFLFVLALFFGLYIIHKHTHKNRFTSIK
ncbi:MAG: hypothetical protein K9I26_03745 [Flavobacterium sp.]|nr:hypothetical protein [Flavobacterium sp.]